MPSTKPECATWNCTAIVAPEETPDTVTWAPSAPSGLRGSAASAASSQNRDAKALSLQLREIPEDFERLRIGEGIGVCHRHAVHHGFDRELHDLAVLRARNVGHRDDARRHVARRSVPLDLEADALLERGIELIVGAQLDE